MNEREHLSETELRQALADLRRRKRESFARNGRKALPRLVLWGVVLLALVVGLAVGHGAAAEFVATGGHLLGMLALAVGGVVLVLLVSMYGLDAWMQAREVNRAVDKVDDAHHLEPKREHTIAEAVVLLAGALQTLGFWVMLGLVVLAVLLHASEMLMLVEAELATPAVPELPAPN